MMKQFLGNQKPLDLTMMMIIIIAIMQRINETPRIGVRIIGLSIDGHVWSRVTPRVKLKGGKRGI